MIDAFYSRPESVIIKMETKEGCVTNDRKLRTAAFIDYEYWYIALQKGYGLSPDIQGWFNEAKDSGAIQEVTFFGNFSQGGLMNEVRRIRSFTNRIVDTVNTNPHYKKDFTDFIMLDHIYQKLFSSPETEQFILFTGDGHFSSVTAYLRNFHDKAVGVYGIKGSVSNHLTDAASWYIEFPRERDYLFPYIMMHVRNFQNVGDSDRIKPTFNKTVEYVAYKNSADYELVRAALGYMLDNGYVIQERVKSLYSTENTFLCLVPDWEKLRRDGYTN